MLVWIFGAEKTTQLLDKFGFKQERSEFIPRSQKIELSFEKNEWIEKIWINQTIWISFNGFNMYLQSL